MTYHYSFSCPLLFITTTLFWSRGISDDNFCLTTQMKPFVQTVKEIFNFVLRLRWWFINRFFFSFVCECSFMHVDNRYYRGLFLLGFRFCYVVDHLPIFHPYRFVTVMVFFFYSCTDFLFPQLDFLKGYRFRTLLNSSIHLS